MTRQLFYLWVANGLMADDDSALSHQTLAPPPQLNRDTGRAPDAAEYLAKTLERFTEGFDTADFLEANSILKELL